MSDILYTTTFTPITDGYTCAHCHQWIAPNVIHACSNQYQNYNLSPALILDEETKQLLRRIAAALEKLAG